MLKNTKPAEGWFGPLAGVVLALTLARLVALAFNHTDLFVDEAQYWLWGQNPDFGYYSKPPLIAWVIRAVGELAGSNAPFWVRMPGAVMHGLTAIILAATAARLSGARAAFWVGVSYVTLPFVTVGSLLISTDTIMAPGFAGAFYAWVRLAEERKARWAALAGAALGLAFLAKYAAIYFLLGAGLAAALVPAMRVGWPNGALFLVAFGAVIAPNVIWNLSHDLTTVSHTMDNIGWVEAQHGPRKLNPGGLVEFALSQFAVFGPLLMAAFLWAIVPVWRAGGQGRGLLCFALPALLIVCVQALMDKAYANWAIAAYFGATLVVVPWLQRQAPRLLPWSLAVNLVIAIALPMLTITAPWPEKDGKPLLKRYLGQADMVAQIVGVARESGAGAVFARERGLLASLYYYSAGSGLVIYAPRPVGRPDNYYEQMFSLPEDRPVTLYVLSTPPACAGAPVAQFDVGAGAFAGQAYAAYLLPEGCLPDEPR